MNATTRPVTGDDLVVLSVPFLKSVRFVLSSQVYGALSRRFAILVVGPFADQDSFRDEFGRDDVQFLQIPSQPHLSWIGSKLYSLSEGLRLAGFLFRHRAVETAYHWGLWLRPETEPSFAQQLVRRALGPLGYLPGSWRAVDRLLNRSVFDTAPLHKATRGYRSVVVLQTANWGYQERYLARFAAETGCRRALLPYTTDQLTINGDLLTDFDLVFAQGPVEARAAAHSHGLPEQRIVPTGMVWLRTVEALRSEASERAPQKRDESRRRILYAGVSPLYFPRRAEFDALRAMTAAARSGRLPAVEIRYRPIVDDENVHEIRAAFADEPLVEVEVPQKATWSINGYVTGQIREELLDYVATLVWADVMIMSRTTSMALDAILLNRTCIANFADPTRSLEDLRSDGRLVLDPVRFVEHLPVALTLDELVDMTERALSDPSWHADSRKRLMRDWDFNKADYAQRIVGGLERLVA
jgi:hypothetical protein